ncbi:hypothetical protein RB195_008206 [Necator americanus]|uniref:Uncharacterized protein n=1 Tax=Necator americanus TaxID=51031 RepID=A0ABR1CNF0_NECAM
MAKGSGFNEKKKKHQEFKLNGGSDIIGKPKSSAITKEAVASSSLTLMPRTLIEQEAAAKRSKGLNPSAWNENNDPLPRDQNRLFLTNKLFFF